MSSADPVRLRLLLAYDGGGFRGFAPNPGVRTVAGVLGDALQRRLGHPVQLTCAGRTDAGVHARAQVVTLDVPAAVAPAAPDAAKFDSPNSAAAAADSAGVLPADAARYAPDAAKFDSPDSGVLPTADAPDADADLAETGAADTGAFAADAAAPAAPTVDAAWLGDLRRALNRMCGPEVAVLSVERAAPDFDARFSALARTYRYTIDNSEVRDVFRRQFAWHVPQPLDFDAMDAALPPLLGEHDFASFCARATSVVDGVERVAPTTRRVLTAHWERPAEAVTTPVDTDVPGRAPQELSTPSAPAHADLAPPDLPHLTTQHPSTPPAPGLAHFEITANSFCRQMVRSIVGTLVDVGLGRRSAGDMAGILAARDRAAAGQVAPPHGLCLWEVTYP